MNLKFILDDVDSAIIGAWQSLEQCSHASAIRKLVADIQTLKQDIKAAKTHKQEISSQFKLYKGEAEKLAELKADMQKISHTLGELENARKSKEQTLLDLFTEQTAQALPDFPRRFTHTQSAKVADTNYIVEQADDAHDWNTYLEQHPQASAYHQFHWKDVIEKSFGHRCIYLLARDAATSRVAGLLPLVGFSSKVFGRFAVSVPYFNYGGPLADSVEVIRKLVDYAQNLQSQYDWSHIEYRCCENILTLPSESRKASMILALPETMDELENRLGAKVRAQYKLAEKEVPQVRFGGMELLDDYYRVFAHNMRDLGTPVYSENFFRNILLQFPEQCTLVVAYIVGKPMATAFLFGFRDMLEIPWASTLRKANQYNLNMWMYKNILNFAIAKKYKYFDFGRSTIDAGTFKFKKQWGAKPLMHYWYYAMPNNESAPQLNPDNPKFKLAIALWKKLPVAISKVLGPPIIKNIP